MNKSVNSFLAKHNFVQHLDILSTANAILSDMQKGLKGEKSDQDMIKTFCSVPTNTVKNENVIVIDAGGTNFRSCLVTFDKDGNSLISDLQKTKMPGVEKELSKNEFFEQIANNIEHLKNKADKIGFCFSYPMEIQKNGDGILLGFSKEVKAPEVVGSLIGKELKNQLEKNGWSKIKKITLCNDTVSALLAGNACKTDSEKYSSYIGYILGTGMNAAYLQPKCEDCGIDEQIIVCESGKFLSVNRSDFDVEFGKTTNNSSMFFMEKLCSGAYLGNVSLFALKMAVKDQLFSEETSKKIENINQLSTIEINEFLHSPYNKENILGKITNESTYENDAEKIFLILDAIVERSARYSAAILVACAIQTGKGKNPTKPICILCNGTTFFKTYKIKERVLGYLDQILTNQMQIYWNVVSCENDITLGTAIAGTI